VASFEITTDMWQPGSWDVRSDHPSALAAISDALVQSLALDADAMALWAQHYDEQAHRAEDAYATEREELGYGPAIHVVALPREPRPHWVWIDRLHLLAAGAPPARGSRLLGLYAGGKGRITIAVTDPSVTHPVMQQLHGMIDAEDRWNAAPFVDQCRFVLRYDGLTDGVDRRGPQGDVVRIRAPQLYAQSIQQALTQLSTIVAAW
jgi:hypothetical protein